MADQVIAVALPVDDAARAALVGLAAPLQPGSVVQPCADCGQVLAVGPATALALAADTSIPLCCPTCGVGRCHNSGIVIEVNLTRHGPAH